MDLIYYLLMVYGTVVLGNPCLNQTLNTVPYPHNCNTFVVCWMSKPYFQACPMGSLFDTITNNCQPWAIAICWHFIYPASRRPLPPLSHVKRILPPIAATFSTQYLPADVTTQTTKLKEEQSITEQYLLTKSTTVIRSQLINDKIFSKSNELTPQTTKTFLTLGTSTDNTSNIPITSRTNIAQERVATLFVTRSSSQKDVTNDTIELLVTESTTKKANLEPLSTTKLSTEVSALTSLITGSTRTEPQLSEQIATKHITTPSTDTKLEAESPTSLSESTTIFTDTITELSPDMTSYTLQPLTITSLIHKRKPTTKLSKTTSTSLHTTEKTEINKFITEATRVTSEPSMTITEPEISYTANVTTLKPLPPITNTVISQKSEESSDRSTTSTITTSTDSTTEANVITSILRTKDSETPLPIVPVESTTTIHTSIKPTSAKDISITEINSIHQYWSPATGSQTGFIERKQTVPSTLLTSHSIGAADINSDILVGSTTSKIQYFTDINSIDKEMNTATGIPTTISEGKQTLPPIIPTYATNVVTATTSEKTLTSTDSVGSSTTEINSIDQDWSPATGPQTGFIERKQTVPPTLITSPSIGAADIKSDILVGSTTSKVQYLTDIYSINEEMITATGITTTIFESEQNLQPIIPTYTTNAVKATTSEKTVSSTDSVGSSTTEINSIDQDRSSATGPQTGFIERKQTVPPTLITLPSIGAADINSDILVGSTTSKVQYFTDINSRNKEMNTATGIPTTIFESEQTLPSIIPSYTANVVTATTSEKTVSSTDSVGSSTTEINSIDQDWSPATGAQTGLIQRKQTVPPTLITLPSIGAAAIKSDILLGSTTSKVKYLTDIYSRNKEMNTASGSPTTIFESEQTLPPIIPSYTTNVVTATTSEKTVTSTDSVGSSTTEINSIDRDWSPATGSQTGFIERKQTVPPTLLTSPSIGAADINSDTLVESNTSKVQQHFTDINSIDKEMNTATGIPTTISEGKQTLPPIIPTYTTNVVTATTNVKTVTSTDSVGSSTTEINSIDQDRSPATGSQTVFIERKQTVPPTLITSPSIGAAEINSDILVGSTTSKEQYFTDINSRNKEMNTATGFPTTIFESEQTLPPIILTHTTNVVTATTSEKTVTSTDSVGSSTTELNSIDQDWSPATGSETGFIERKQTVPPTLITLPSIGAADIKSDILLGSTTSKVQYFTDINARNKEMNTATGITTTIFESEQTLPPIIPTYTTNVVTATTSEKTVTSTGSVGSSITEINSIDQDRSPVTVIQTGFIERKQTVPSTLITSPSIGAADIKSDILVGSTTSKVQYFTDINSRNKEMNTATGIPTTISEGKQTLPSIISSYTANVVTATTSEKTVSSTDSVGSNTTEINSIHQDWSPATGAQTGLIERKQTVPPTLITSPSIGAADINSDILIGSTTSKVKYLTDIYSRNKEMNTASGSPTTIFESEQTLPPIIPSYTTNVVTATTSEKTVTSTDSVGSSTTEINSIDRDWSPATGSQTGFIERKQTVPPTLLTSPSIGAADINSDTLVESNTSKVQQHFTDINSIDKEMNTATGIPTTISEGKQTLPPIIPTYTTNVVTATTNVKTVTSTDSVGSSTTEINSIDQDRSPATGSQTVFIERKQTVPPTLITSPSIGAAEINSDILVGSTTSKEQYFTDINSRNKEMNTATGFPTTIFESEQTLPPIILTHTTNVVTATTSEKTVTSTDSVGSSTTELNSIDQDWSPATGSETGFIERKQTVPPTLITLPSIGAADIKSDILLGSTTSKVQYFTDINARNKEMNTATGITTTIFESEQTLPPIIPTYTTNVVTATTSEKTVTSTGSVGSSITEINSIDQDRSPVTVIQTGFIERKQTVPSTLITSPSIGAADIKSDILVGSTTSKVQYFTDINSRNKEMNTATGIPTTISEGKQTLPSIISSYTANVVTATTSEKTVSSTDSVGSNTTEINSIHQDWSPATGAQTGLIERKQTVPPTLITSPSIGAADINSDILIGSTTSKVKYLTDIYSRNKEMNTASGSPTTIFESEQTLPPIIPSYTTNVVTATTSEKTVTSTDSVGSSTTEINSIDRDWSPTTGSQTGFIERKQTVPPTLLTSPSIGAADINSDTLVESNTSKVQQHFTDINSIDKEMNTATSIPTTISEGKQTLPPIIPTYTTNVVTATTSEKTVSSTDSVGSNTTEINSIHQDWSPATGAQTGLIERKQTVPPTLITSPSIGAADINSDILIGSTTSKVKYLTDIYSRNKEMNTASGSPTTIFESEQTLPPIIPSYTTNVVTATTSEKTVTSTDSVGSSTTEINSIDRDWSPATGSQTGFIERKQTVPPTLLTSPSIGAADINSDTLVESNTSKVQQHFTDINSIDKEMNTATSIPTTISEGKQTLPPIIPTYTTNVVTATTNVKTVTSTDSVGSSTTEINSIDQDRSPATGSQTVFIERKQTVPPTLITSPSIGAAEINSDILVGSTTSKVQYFTDINSRNKEMNTATGFPTTIFESEQTLPPIIPSYTANVVTATISEKTVTSTDSVGSSTTEINSIDRDWSPATGSQTVFIERKQTVPPTLITLPSIGAVDIKSDILLGSTTSKVQYFTDINSRNKEMNTATGIPTTISESKQTLPPIIPTYASNVVSATTNEKTVTSTDSVGSSTTELNSIDQKWSPATGSQFGLIKRKQTVPPSLITSPSIGAADINSDILVGSTTSKVQYFTDINSRNKEMNTATGIPTTIFESEQTLPSIIPSYTANVVTATTSEKTVTSTDSVGSSTTEINSIDQDWSPATGSQTGLIERKQTVPPTLITSPSIGAADINSDILIGSTTSKVQYLTDIYSRNKEMNTATGIPTTISEGKHTLPPIIPTYTTNVVTATTNVKTVTSTDSVGSSTTEINSIDQDRSSATGSQTVFIERKQTVPPTLITSPSIGAAEINSDILVGSTTSNVQYFTDINSITKEMNTATGIPTTIFESEQTLPPIIPTYTTNVVTATTSEKTVTSTDSVGSSTTEINSIHQDWSPGTGSQTGFIERKQTIPSTLLTSPSIGAADINSDTLVGSTTSKVQYFTDINSIDKEMNTATGIPNTISESIQSCSFAMTTSASDGATAVIDTSVQSATEKVTDITESKSIYSKPITAAYNPVSIGVSKPTLPEKISTLAYGDNAISYSTAVESTSSNSIGFSENNIITELSGVVTEHKLASSEINTTTTKGDSETNNNEIFNETRSITSSSIVTSILVTLDEDITPSENIQTLFPTTITSESSFNVKTISLLSTTMQQQTYPPELPETITLQPITDVDTNSLRTYTDTKNIESNTSASLNLTIPSKVTEKYPTTYTTKRPLPSMTMSPENLIIKSNTSGDPTITVSTVLKGTIETYTSGPERNKTTDLTMRDMASISSTFTSKKSLLPLTVATISHSNKPDISTKHPLPPLTPTTTRTVKQENVSLNTRRILPPVPTTPNRPCPYNKPSTTSTTSEAPIQPQLPDCYMNDNFLYPDLVDCKFYYKCFNGIMQKLNCKPKYGFNPHLMKCVPEEKAKCGLYKSAADQRSYLISFLLFNQIIKNMQLKKEDVET